MGHEKLGKSWNLLFKFPGLESREIFSEGHGKAICVWKINKKAKR